MNNATSLNILTNLGWEKCKIDDHSQSYDRDDQFTITFSGEDIPV